jgi:hypothetical protein
MDYETDIDAPLTPEELRQADLWAQLLEAHQLLDRAETNLALLEAGHPDPGGAREHHMAKRRWTLWEMAELLEAMDSTRVTSVIAEGFLPPLVSLAIAEEVRRVGHKDHLYYVDKLEAAHITAETNVAMEQQFQDTFDAFTPAEQDLFRNQAKEGRQQLALHRRQSRAAMQALTDYIGSLPQDLATLYREHGWPDVRLAAMAAVCREPVKPKAGAKRRSKPRKRP